MGLPGDPRLGVMQKGRFFRSLAFVTALTVTATAVTGDPLLFAQTVEPRPSFPPFLLPAELGRITETHLSNNARAVWTSRFVIHIQDAHAQPEVQEGIRKLLHWLSDHSSPSLGRGASLLVAIEGATGPIHPEYLEFFKEFPEANEAVAEDLFQKGELSGAERFAWDEYRKGRRPTRVFGVEDPSLYRENLKTFRGLVFRRKEAELALASLGARTEKEGSKILNPELRKFLREKARKETDWVGYLERGLKERAKRFLGIHLNDPIEQLRFPNLTRFFYIKRAEAEKDRKISRRKRKLLDLISGEIDTRELGKEMERLEEALESKLARSQQEKEFLRTLKDLDLLRRLVLLELTREEHDLLASRRQAIETLAKKPKLQSLIKQALQFYQGAQTRDRLLVEGALEQGPGGIVALVTGGFHTPGLVEELKARGISYAVISPALTEEKGKSPYLGVMRRENADLSRYFKKPVLNKQQALLFKGLIEQALPILAQKYGISSRDLPTWFTRAVDSHPLLKNRLQALAFPRSEEPFARLVPTTGPQRDEIDPRRHAIPDAAILGADYAFFSSSENFSLNSRLEPIDLAFPGASGRAKVRPAPPRTEWRWGNLEFESGPLTLDQLPTAVPIRSEARAQDSNANKAETGISVQDLDLESDTPLKWLLKHGGKILQENGKILEPPKRERILSFGIWSEYMPSLLDWILNQERLFGGKIYHVWLPWVQLGGLGVPPDKLGGFNSVKAERGMFVQSVLEGPHKEYLDPTEISRSAYADPDFLDLVKEQQAITAPFTTDPLRVISGKTIQEWVDKFRAEHYSDARIHEELRLQIFKDTIDQLLKSYRPDDHPRLQAFADQLIKDRAFVAFSYTSKYGSQRKLISFLKALKEQVIVGGKRKVVVLNFLERGSKYTFPEPGSQPVLFHDTLLDLLEGKKVSDPLSPGLRTWDLKSEGLRVVFDDLSDPENLRISGPSDDPEAIRIINLRIDDGDLFDRLWLNSDWAELAGDIGLKKLLMAALAEAGPQGLFNPHLRYISAMAGQVPAQIEHRMTSDAADLLPQMTAFLRLIQLSYLIQDPWNPLVDDETKEFEAKLRDAFMHPRKRLRKAFQFLASPGNLFNLFVHMIRLFEDNENWERIRSEAAAQMSRKLEIEQGVLKPTKGPVAVVRLSEIVTGFGDASLVKMLVTSLVRAGLKPENILIHLADEDPEVFKQSVVRLNQVSRRWMDEFWFFYFAKTKSGAKTPVLLKIEEPQKLPTLKELGAGGKGRSEARLPPESGGQAWAEDSGQSFEGKRAFQEIENAIEKIREDPSVEIGFEEILQRAKEKGVLADVARLLEAKAHEKNVFYNQMSQQENLKPLLEELGYALPRPRQDFTRAHDTKEMVKSALANARRFALLRWIYAPVYPDEDSWLNDPKKAQLFELLMAHTLRISEGELIRRRLKEEYGGSAIGETWHSKTNPKAVSAVTNLRLAFSSSVASDNFLRGSETGSEVIHFSSNLAGAHGLAYYLQRLLRPVLIELAFFVFRSLERGENARHWREGLIYRLLRLSGQDIVVFVRRTSKPKIFLSSLDLNRSEVIEEPSEEAKKRGYYLYFDTSFDREPLRSLKAALVETGVIPSRSGEPLKKLLVEKFEGGGIEILSYSGVRGEAGSGFSSNHLGAVLGAIYRLMGMTHLSDLELSDRVMRVERMLKIGGGFNDFIGGSTRGLKVTRVSKGSFSIKMDHLGAVDRSLVKRLAIFDSGLRKQTGVKQVSKWLVYLIRHPRAYSSMLDALKVTNDMEEALRKEKNYSRLGRLMTEYWELMKKVDPKATHPVIDHIMKEAAPLVEGFMVTGAGGGGTLIFMAQLGKAKKLRRRLRELEREIPRDARFKEAFPPGSPRPKLLPLHTDGGLAVKPFGGRRSELREGPAISKEDLRWQERLSRLLRKNVSTAALRSVLSTFSKSTLPSNPIGVRTISDPSFVPPLESLPPREAQKWLRSVADRWLTVAQEKLRQKFGRAFREEPKASKASAVHLLLALDQKGLAPQALERLLALAMREEVLSSRPYHLTLLVPGVSAARDSIQKDLKRQIRKLGFPERLIQNFDVLSVPDSKQMVSVISKSKDRFPGYSSGIVYVQGHPWLERLGFMGGLVRLRFGEKFTIETAAFTSFELLRDELARNRRIQYEVQDLESWVERFGLAVTLAEIDRTIRVLKQLSNQA